MQWIQCQACLLVALKWYKYCTNTPGFALATSLLFRPRGKNPFAQEPLMRP